MPPATPTYEMEYRAVDFNPGDRYELSRGRAIYCAPTGGDGSRGTVAGAHVLDTDPAVQSAGIDAGFSPSPHDLRAPDISVGNVPDAPGWIKGVPPLAVEYAGSGQDEPKLQEKISDLLAAGTKWVWVVRLIGERHVEVYERGKPMTRVRTGQALRAPGVLQNPVLVEALFDREVAHEATLRNLLQRKGYDSLEALREEVREEGREEGREAGREAGREEGLKPLLHLFERRLKRPLAQSERAEIAARLTRLGDARLGDVVIDLSSEKLEEWLSDPSAE